MFKHRDALIVAATVIVVIFFTVLLYVVIRLIQRHFRPNRVAVTQQPLPKTISLQPQHDPKRRLYNHAFFNRGSSTKTALFNWADHPTLINDVVENGWSRFAFIQYNNSSTVRSSLFNSLRAITDDNHQVEETWEVGLNSVDFMQKLRFKINGSNLSTSINSSKLTVRMNLPLPGPQLGNSFPPEAYFEITVVSCLVNKGLVKGDGENLEKAKLLSQHSDSSIISGIKSSAAIAHTGSKKGSGIMMSVGLTVCGSTMNKLPGSYPGSIAFHSNGSVYLTGMKLVFESEKQDWAQPGKVIGCGFDPRQKKVFFTLDSELIHVVHCKSEDFGMPMYPIIASNIDMTATVNLGQSSFSYGPANVNRTPNPCFTGGTSLEYDDSKELFSMERLDSEWLAHSATVRSTASNNSHQNNYYANNNNRIGYDDEESEAELFEIVLDSS
ncbi:uncharacterized protein LOC141596906 [Silene latifolia]|uniref:uncharacterized protein LOC141596906 n=1 Tax=Silene latifolia TaxID=37657 RepID=UPI003D76EF64